MSNESDFTKAYSRYSSHTRARKRFSPFGEKQHAHLPCLASCCPSGPRKPVAVTIRSLSTFVHLPSCLFSFVTFYSIRVPSCSPHLVWNPSPLLIQKSCTSSFLVSFLYLIFVPLLCFVSCISIEYLV